MPRRTRHNPERGNARTRLLEAADDSVRAKAACTRRKTTTAKITQLACACGTVQLEVERAPIISTECYCGSCRSAGDKLQALPEAPRFMETNVGTRFVLYRKDRIRFRKGAEASKEFRLTPASKTRRVVATCCNTPVFLEFHNGHWLSLYGCLWPAGALPALDQRTMTADLPEGVALADDVPNAKHQSVSFFAKLLGAWIAMGFKAPKVTIVSGEIHA